MVIRRSTTSTDGIELVIGRTSPNIVHISTDDIICRTESRTQHYAFGVFPRQSKRRANFYLAGTSETDSQKWIAAIRKMLRPPLLPVEDNEFSVAVIDNMFSRSSGLTGLYGTLRISSENLTIVDPFSSKTKAEWPWNTLSQFHVSCTIAKEDKGHICTIVTSSKFPMGVGQIHLFCTEAVTLTQKLQTKGRPSSLLTSPLPKVTASYRHNTFSFQFPQKEIMKAAPSSPLIFPNGTLRKLSPSTPRSLTLGRRLSKSEGNLRAIFDQMDNRMAQTPGYLEYLSNGIMSSHGGSHDSNEKRSMGSDESCSFKGKVAPSIISAGIGLILSTPGCSDGDNESLHEYQKVGNDESDDEFGGLHFIAPLTSFAPPRRESGFSVASGVYEEIDDLTITFDPSSLNTVQESESESPPPLPPRRGCLVKSVSEDMEENGYTNMLQPPRTPSKFISRSAGNTPLPSPPSLSRSYTAPSSSEIMPCMKNSSWQNNNNIEESDYLPMMPSGGFFANLAKSGYLPKDHAIEEPHYMVMASVNIT